MEKKQFKDMSASEVADLLEHGGVAIDEVTALCARTIELLRLAAAAPSVEITTKELVQSIRRGEKWKLVDDAALGADDKDKRIAELETELRVTKLRAQSAEKIAGIGQPLR